ncbi:LysR family transcriptional regulator [Rhodanobacter denitrificans]|uniref:LysR family transcriptional regulator n=1 Tax=Rhodanobacter denitrificans TaxID=666685 RepID=UPI000260EA5F|nr:LysR family transcriptional regulator [Rhodanobacter denitrificans]EIM03189.1 HTH-type transcriptional regulator [Rhodanobacter denitrificans]UJM90388.1 LysR family transcriptional regulator [Rhodanobacter denitrificans]
MASLDLDLLRTFIAVAERGSFSAAASRISRSQAAISQQVQRLEAQLGETLFARNSREVRLSPAGERLLGYASRLLHLSEEAILAVRDGTTRSVVRLGVTDEIAAYALMPALAEIRGQRTDLLFEITTGTTRDLVAQLDTRCDLVIGLGLPGHAAGTTLARLPLRWMGHWPGKGAVPLVLYPEGCLMRGQALAALDRAGLPWEITTSTSSVASVEAAARAGLAVGVLAAHLAAPDLPRARGLPALPSIDVRIFAGKAAVPVAEALGALIAKRLRARRAG